MKVSWIKSDMDKKSFKFPEVFGFDVFYVHDNEDVDFKIDELIANKYNTIIISKELAGFSEKINSIYVNNNKIEIIINNK